MPIRAEALVVVGGEEDTRDAASLWRFGPKGWTKDFLYDPDPRSIQRKAEEQIPLEEVYKDWPVSEDPSVHDKAMQEILHPGATHVYVHSGQKASARSPVLRGAGLATPSRSVVATASRHARTGAPA